MENHSINQTSLEEKILFKKKIGKLKSFTGQGTELISVFIPPGTNRSSVMNQLSEEVSQSSNIKDPKTRKNVQAALRKIIAFLKRIDFKIPETGLAVFSGNISNNPSKTDIKLFTVKPIQKLDTKLYWCDSSFNLDPLKEMLTPKDSYGLITIDKNEATLAVLKGKKYEIIGTFKSRVPGKIRAGGQCISPESIVLLAENKSKPIKDLKVGEVIACYDFNKKKIVSSKVKAKWKSKKSRVKISIENSTFSLNCSKDHTVFIFAENKVKKVKAIELKKGNVMLRAGKDNELIPVKIDSIKKGKKIEMIDIEVGKKNFFANGFLVHNSAQRFERLREEAEHDFYKKIAENANKIFTENNDTLKGVIIGGPGMTKNYFLETDLLDHRIKQKILGKVDLCYTDEAGIRELVNKAQELLKDAEITHEKQLLQKFFERIAKNELVLYGEKEIIEYLKQGRIETIILSEALNKSVLKANCNNCGKENLLIIENSQEQEKKCVYCSSNIEFEEQDFIEWVTELARETNTKTVIVSIETEEGSQFYHGFGGIGAFLRY